MQPHGSSDAPETATQPESSTSPNPAPLLDDAAVQLSERVRFTGIALLVGAGIAALWESGNLLAGQTASFTAMLSVIVTAATGVAAALTPAHLRAPVAQPLAVLCAIVSTLLGITGPGGDGLGTSLVVCLLTAVMLPMPALLRAGLLVAQAALILLLVPVTWWSLVPVLGVLGLAWWIGERHFRWLASAQRTRESLEGYVATREAELEERQAQLIRQAKWATLGRMATGVAHEIKNPLQAALVDLDTARRSGDVSLLADVEVSLRRIDGTIKEISRLRGSSGNRVQACPLPRLVQASLQSTRLGFKAMHISVGELPDAVVQADPDFLVDVLANLLTNAQHAKEQEGRVTVHIDGALRGDRVLLHVDDDGPGIPPDALDRVFETFETTKEAGKGTGLGLPISRSKMQSMGGDLWAEDGSSLGGARLVIALELAPPDARPVDIRSPSSMPVRDRLPRIHRRTPTPAPGEPSVHGTLLLVDDDAQVRRALKRMLSREWHVLDASGTAAARKLARGHDIDAVLCDMSLHQEDALDVIDVLVAIDPTFKHRTVFMTGEPVGRRLLALADANPERILQKPFDRRTARGLLLAAMRGTLPVLISDDLESPPSIDSLGTTWTVDPPTEELLPPHDPKVRG